MVNDGGPRFILLKRGAKYSSNLVTLPTVQPSCLFILGVSWLSFIAAALSFPLPSSTSIPSPRPFRDPSSSPTPIRLALSHTNSTPASYLFWINASALSIYEFLYSTTPFQRTSILHYYLNTFLVSILTRNGRYDFYVFTVIDRIINC